jgi:serine phosphatase RsbU (regulator of sigma subunit)
MVEGVSINQPAAPDRGHVLIVENDIALSSSLESQLISLGFQVLLSQSGKQAIALCDEYDVDLIFMKALLFDMDGTELIKHIKQDAAGKYMPVVLLLAGYEDVALLDCMTAGGDYILFYGFTGAVLEACVIAMERLRDLKHLYKSTLHEQVVGKQILSAALSARNITVDGVEILSRSAAIFCGDLVLSARKPNGGLHILLADFTGHGLSAAIGILPVADMFSVMTEKGFEPEKILENINTKLHTLLPTGMFMAACMLKIDSRICNASVWNCGLPDVYLLDHAMGKIKRRAKSTHIPLGIHPEIDGRLKCDFFDIKSGDQLIMHTDGLTDVVDSAGVMFGVSRLEQVMEEALSADKVFVEIVNEFDKFCVHQELSDDATLVSIPCGINLLPSSSGEAPSRIQFDSGVKADWGLKIELSGQNLRDVNPVQIILDQYRMLGDLIVNIEKLQTILSELYDNALYHGMLGSSSTCGLSVASGAGLCSISNNVFDGLQDCYIRIELQRIMHHGNPSLLVLMEDCGSGFDHVSLLSDMKKESKKVWGAGKSGISMIMDSCHSLHYHGKGNKVEVILDSCRHSGEGYE